MVEIRQFVIEFEYDRTDPDWIGWSLDGGLVSGKDQFDKDSIFELIETAICAVR